MYFASSDARNAITDAAYSGPTCGTGGIAPRRSSRSAFFGMRNWPWSGVLMPPGHTQLARKPCFAYSTAITRVIERMPPLDAAYAAIHGCEPSAEVDDVLTMLPLLLSKCGIAARHIKNVPVRLMR